MISDSISNFLIKILCIMIIFYYIKKKIMHMDVLITRINKMDNKIIIFEIRSHLSNIIPPCYKKQTTKYSQVSVTL